MKRRHDLDWVRIAAFGVLVLYHVGMYYVMWDWHIKSPSAGPAIEPLMLLAAPWRLSLLFLVSGVASAFLLARRQDRFLCARSWRLLLPLLFGMLVVVPPQAYYELLDSRYPGGYHDGYLAFWARYLAADPGFCDNDGCLNLPTWNHLWFLAYLWVYTVVCWLLVGTAPDALRRLGDGLARLLSGWGALAWPIVMLAAIRLALVARFESTHALVDDWYNHAQYLGVFLVGWLMARREVFWQSLQRLRWPALSLAAGSYAFLTWYFGGGAGDSPSDVLRWTQRACWALNQWTAIAAICGFAYRLRDADSAALRYLTPAVFPVYILHQTVIIVLAWQLRPLALPSLPEGLLLAAATLTLCLAAYEAIRRVRWLRPMFGLRVDEVV